MKEVKAEAELLDRQSAAAEVYRILESIHTMKLPNLDYTIVTFTEGNR